MIGGKIVVSLFAVDGTHAAQGIVRASSDQVGAVRAQSAPDLHQLRPRKDTHPSALRGPGELQLRVPVRRQVGIRIDYDNIFITN